MEEETLTPLCGFIDGTVGRSEDIHGYLSSTGDKEKVFCGSSPIYSDTALSEAIGTFVVMCPIVGREGYTLFSP
jgi:hypothetical protein